MSKSILDRNRRTWEDKPVLRTIYASYYARLSEAIVAGKTLEIGGGTGNFKACSPDVLSTDIVSNPWLDLVADAQALPFEDQSFCNIVMVDVLHHIEQPIRFFTEAQRILRPGGRLVMIEPSISWLTWPFYHWLHPEPVDMSFRLEEPVAVNTQRVPFDANQAIPSLIFTRQLDTFSSLFPQLSLTKLDWFDLLAYPLSGGFRRWSLIGHRLASRL